MIERCPSLVKLILLTSSCLDLSNVHYLFTMSIVVLNLEIWHDCILTFSPRLVINISCESLSTWCASPVLDFRSEKRQLICWRHLVITSFSTLRLMDRRFLDSLRGRTRIQLPVAWVIKTRQSLHYSNLSFFSDSLYIRHRTFN